MTPHPIRDLVRRHEAAEGEVALFLVAAQHGAAEHHRLLFHGDRGVQLDGGDQVGVVESFSRGVRLLFLRRCGSARPPKLPLVVGLQRLQVSGGALQRSVQRPQPWVVDEGLSGGPSLLPFGAETLKRL